MSTIDEVRAADKKVREGLNALKNASLEEQDELGVQLQQATDEYAPRNSGTADVDPLLRSSGPSHSLIPTGHDYAALA